MFIVFKLRYGNLQNSFQIYCRNSSTKDLQMDYIEYMSCFQSLQYSHEAVSTYSYCCLKNWEVQWDTSWKYVPINGLARAILKLS